MSVRRALAGEAPHARTPRGVEPAGDALRVVAAGLAGGALATGGEVLWRVRDLRPDETLGVVSFAAAAGLVLALALAAGLAVLGALRGRRLRAATPLGLLTATTLLAAGLAFVFFLGGALGLGLLREVTFGGPLLAALFALAVASLVGGLGAGRTAEAAVAGLVPLAVAVPVAHAAAAADRGGLALATLAAALLLGVLAVGLGRRAPRATAAALLAGLAALAALTWRGPEPPAATHAAAAAPPGSVVLIVLDTTRADALGAYGAERPTPAFDALARDGLLVEEVISPGPWTVPSHASLFTGLPPHVHGAWYGRRPWLEDGFETLAERYRAAGYETAAFYTNGWLRTANLLQGFETAHDSVRRPLQHVLLLEALRWVGLGPVHWIDKGGTETVAEVGRWAAERDPERPFFLFVNLLEAHGPYLPPRAWRQLPDGVSQLDAIRAHRGHDFVAWHEEGVSGGPRVRALRALYAGGVAYQDDVLGRLLEALEAHVDLSEAAVVVTADHGENLGEGGRWNHLFAANGCLTHVPLAIRAPGLPPGRLAGPFQSTDLVPTLAGFSRLPPEGEAEASAETAAWDEPLRPIGPQAVPRRRTFAEVHPAVSRLGGAAVAPGPRPSAMRHPVWVVREDGFSLARHGDGALRLYDLARDPAEARDVAAGHPERRRAMSATLDGWAGAEATPAAPGPGGDGGPQLSPAERERLRELGYL